MNLWTSLWVNFDVLIDNQDSYGFMTLIHQRKALWKIFPMRLLSFNLNKQFFKESVIKNRRIFFMTDDGQGTTAPFDCASLIWNLVEIWLRFVWDLVETIQDSILWQVPRPRSASFGLELAVFAPQGNCIPTPVTNNSPKVNHEPSQTNLKQILNKSQTNLKQNQ